jgi:hypothetical protein
VRKALLSSASPLGVRKSYAFPSGLQSNRAALPQSSAAEPPYFLGAGRKSTAFPHTERHSRKTFKVMIQNYSTSTDFEILDLIQEIKGHSSLGDVLSWAGKKPKSEVHRHLVAEVITQDEYTHDVIVPYKHMFLVYDTT